MAVLSAYRAASGGAAWHGKAAMRTVVIQHQAGLKGRVTQITDLRYGYSVSQQSLGPGHGASGFDGRHVWKQDAEGVVSLESGIAKPLAVDAAYVHANRWWQPKFGGANVVSGQKQRCGRSTCAVLTVTPKHGLPFQAWFDGKSHLLVRISFHAGEHEIIDSFSNYRRVDGVLVPYKRVIDPGLSRHLSNTRVVTTVSFLTKQPLSVFAPPKSKITGITIDNGATRTTLPFRLIANNIYANVRINGHGPLMFLFDTGGTNVLSPSAAKALGIRAQMFVMHATRAADTGGVGLATVRALDIGGARFADLPIAIANVLPQGYGGLPIKGMIGATVFHAFVVRFDYDAHQISLIKPSSFNPKGTGTPIPFELVGDKPVIKATFDGIPGEFVIDTGLAYALLLTPAFVARHHLQANNPKGVTTIAGYGVAGDILAYVARGKLLTVGPFKLPNIVTVMSRMKEGPQATPLFQGMIGNGVLKHFVVTLDYADRTAYFKPVGPLPNDVGRFDRSGLTCLAPAKTGFKIWCVTPHSPARRAGMQLGQIITKVDGKAATSFPLYKFVESMRLDPPGTVVHLTTTQGTITHHFTITLRNQI